MNLSTRRAFLAAVGGIAVAPALALAPQPAAPSAESITFDNIMDAIKHYEAGPPTQTYTWYLHPHEEELVRKHNLINLDI